MLNELDLSQLRALVTVVRSGSVTAAATRLRRTQPAVSTQIKRLEETLGIRLLKRRGGGISLTEAGERLLPYAEQLLDLQDRVLRMLRVQTAAERIRLGVPEDIAETILATTLQTFAETFPHVAVETLVAETPELADRTHAGQLDLSIEERLGAVSGADEWPRPLVWLAAPSWRHGAGLPVPLVLKPEGCPYRQEALRVLTNAGIEWYIAGSSNDWSGIRAAVTAGLGITVAPATLPRPGLRALADDDDGLPDLPSLAASLAWARRPIRTPAAGRLAEILHAESRLLLESAPG